MRCNRYTPNASRSRLTFRFELRSILCCSQHHRIHLSVGCWIHSLQNLWKHVDSRASEYAARQRAHCARRTYDDRSLAHACWHRRREAHFSCVTPSCRTSNSTRTFHKMLSLSMVLRLLGPGPVIRRHVKPFRSSASDLHFNSLVLNWS